MSILHNKSPLLSSLLIVIALVASGCGDGGSSPTSDRNANDSSAVLADSGQRKIISISGNAGLIPIPGAMITLRSASGAILASTTTDSKGKFSFANIEAPAGEALELRASYKAYGRFDTLYTDLDTPESLDNVGINTLTTLIHETAKQEKKTAGEVASGLIEIGAIDHDWQSTTPSRVNTEALGNLRKKSGLADRISALAADLADNDLSPGAMTFFPDAHDGITEIIAGNADHLAVFAGRSATAQISVASLAEQEITLSTDSPNATIESSGNSGSLTYDASRESNATTRSITIKAVGKNGHARIGRLKVEVIVGKTLASKTIGPDGGRLVSPDGNTGIIIPAGSLATPQRITLEKGETASGGELLGVFSESGSVQQAGFLFYWLDEPAVQPKTRAAKGKTESNYCANASNTLTNQWKTFPAWYINGTSPRLPEINGKAPPNLQASSQTGAVLCATHPQEKGNFWNNHQPVLFIHGYTWGNALGGGDGTWGVFPQLVNTMRANENAFSSFEFRWRTDARFQDVANDLAEAIQAINEETHRKVHIVAHSFGGVLIRTLLQKIGSGKNITEQRNYLGSGVKHDASSLIASVTTLGTPHSGIFPHQINNKPDLGSFPKGYADGLAAKVAYISCQQISCYQLGRFVTTKFDLPSTKDKYQINYFSGWLVKALQNTSQRWSTHVPKLIGIGLLNPGIYKISGDKLISKKGQRFFSTDAMQDAPLRDFERVIGYPDSATTHAFPTAWSQITPSSGYFHSPSLNLVEYDSDYYEAHISNKHCNPAKPDQCTHGSFQLVAEMLRKHSNKTAFDTARFKQARPEHLAVDSFNNKAHLSWSIVAGADAYDVVISASKEPSSNGEHSLVPNTNLVIDLKDDSLKYFRVRAKKVNPDGSVLYSAFSEVMPISNLRGVVSGRVTDKKTGKPLAGARISFPMEGETYRTTTNEDGYYVIRVPAAFSSGLIRVDRDGYLPGLITITQKALKQSDFQQKNVQLEKRTANIVAIENGNRLYHLGNDKFEGTINSQFQTGAIGIDMTLRFVLTAEQLASATSPRLRLQARGVEANRAKSRVYINGKEIGFLPKSPSDGSWGSVALDIDNERLHVGANELKIESGYATTFLGRKEYDDFEITNLHLELSKATR